MIFTRKQLRKAKIISPKKYIIKKGKAEIEKLSKKKIPDNLPEIYGARIPIVTENDTY